MIPKNNQRVNEHVSLTLGAHAPEGYGSCPVCVSVCVCVSATLIWGLGLVEV